jgi:hypothetical protein
MVFGDLEELEKLQSSDQGSTPADALLSLLFST